jgi:hypothetical protein
MFTYNCNIISFTKVNYIESIANFLLKFKRASSKIVKVIEKIEMDGERFELSATCV